MSAPLLELRGVSKHFQGLQALSAVDLIGQAGEVRGLIGPNGAGKSTLISCITGVNRIDGGSIYLHGRRIDTLPAYRRARLGIARSFQKIRLAQELSVFENVAVGLAATRQPGFRLLSGRGIAEPVHAALEAAGIADLVDHTAASLSYGKRHLVELARILVARPEVVMLDEPATGLTDAERARLGEVVRGIAEGGALVLLVEHDLDLVGRLCDRVTVIEYGRRIFDGTPAAAQRDEAVIRAYLGTATLAREAEHEEA
ncbi:MAG: ABC transporter ATP-binding protein [Acetobacteraceae bacterium]